VHHQPIPASLAVLLLTAPGCGPSAPSGADSHSNAARGGSGAAGAGGGLGTGGATAGQGGAPGGSGGSAAAGTGNAAGAPPAGAGGGSAGTGSGGTAGDSRAGMGGVAPTAGLGGAMPGGAAGLANGGMSGMAGASPAVWHAGTATTVTESMLSSEYAAWKLKHVKACTDGSSVVTKDGGNVVSEGIGYGMLLATGFDDRALFDGLWKYYEDHEDPLGLMNWSTGVCDAAGNNNANAAADGDLDAAMALVQASARWPDGSYLADAKTLTAAIIASETELCGERAILRPGDKFGGCSDMSSARVNPSYFAPGYYRVFAAKFPDQAERWNALVTGSYELYPLYQARMSGLVPDWAAVDGSDWYGASYSYDACRTPWRVMVDYAWSGEPKAKTMLEGVRGWVDANGTGSMPNNSAFLGSFALAAAYDQQALDTAVSSWLASSGDDSPYFQGTLRVLYLLAAAGKFPSTL
jgi:endo-1,4-beta-D-glucanase Y